MIDIAILILAIAFSFVMVVGTLIIGYLAYKSMEDW